MTGSYWHDIEPGNLHLTLADTGWAKSVWGKFYGQWLAGGVVFVWDFRGKFEPARLLKDHRRPQGHQFLRTAHGLSLPRPRGPLGLRPLGPAPLHHGRRTPERQRLHHLGREARHAHLRRLRPDRNHPADRHLPLHETQGRLHRQAVPGLGHQAPRRERRTLPPRRGRERSASASNPSGPWASFPATCRTRPRPQAS